MCGLLFSLISLSELIVFQRNLIGNANFMIYLLEEIIQRQKNLESIQTEEISHN